MLIKNNNISQLMQMDENQMLTIHNFMKLPMGRSQFVAYTWSWFACYMYIYDVYIIHIKLFIVSMRV